MQHTSPLSRRRFLQAGAAAVAAFHIVPRHVLGGPGHVPPSDKVNIALIGAGGQGRVNLRRLFEQADAQVIAIADPAEFFSLEAFYYKGVAGRKPLRHEIEQHYATSSPNFRCAEYVDFRHLLDREKAVDAVLCATPDHLHAHVSVLAMRAGKHVYCEKPLTHNIWEARCVAHVARETGVATQMGNQGHSTDTIRETYELIRDGAIGPVREVHAWAPNHRWNPSLTTRPTDRTRAPRRLNWDLWLGPREVRPFHSAYFPVGWRDFWAFGGSNIADFGPHDLDAACWALDLVAPTSVEFHPAGTMDDEIAPHGCIGYYQFGPRGHQPPVQITWYDGGLRPSLTVPLPEGEPVPRRGVLFVGDKGVLLCGGAGGPARLLPETRAEDYRKPEPTLPRSNGHHRDWLDACKGGPAPSSHFGYGARLTELALLGVLALRLGERIEWDPAGMRAIGLPDADALITEPRRAGWELA
jgi:predicted dehydrogenase